ncbi:uncharacterized protein LOC120673348 isoform X2 [Panicum virgatum]|nr:uncharacterized protein LOC120673348 isoform X2 [Panicum virgatum]
MGKRFASIAYAESPSSGLELGWTIKDLSFLNDMDGDNEIWMNMQWMKQTLLLCRYSVLRFQFGAVRATPIQSCGHFNQSRTCHKRPAVRTALLLLDLLYRSRTFWGLEMFACRKSHAQECCSLEEFLAGRDGGWNMPMYSWMIKFRVE